MSSEKEAVETPFVLFLRLPRAPVGVVTVTVQELQQEQKHMRGSCARKNLAMILIRERKWRRAH